MDRRLLKLNFTTYLRSLPDLLMERRCVVCGRPLNIRENHLCLGCRADFPYTGYELLEHNPMADKYNARISVSEWEPYQRACALFHYSSQAGYVNIPQGLKYRRMFSEGKHFAAMLGRRLADSELYQDVDLVIPVPLHWTRRTKRGYNQAEIIARSVARELGVPLSTSMLIRARRTRTQTKVKVSSKADNVAGAFRVRKNNLTVRHILLIDDVFTTGSTLAACHDALRTAFSPEIRISIATLAVVG